MRVKREDDRAKMTWILWLREKAILVGKTHADDSGGWGERGYSTE